MTKGVDNMKKLMYILVVFTTLPTGLAAQQTTQTSRTVGYTIRDTADYKGNRYISAWGQHPHVLTLG